MVKPLKDLIAEADKFLGQTKTAAPVISDEVSSLADTLAFATALEDQFVQPEQESYDQDFEKVAKALNKAAAEIEWDVLSKAEQFEKTALARGYSETQVEEALSKIAAAKIKKNLPELVAMGYGPSHADQNSLENKKVKNVGEEKRTLPATQGLGGAR